MKTEIQKERRLNPFALPTDANGRFIIVVVTALVLAWHMGVIFTTLAGEVFVLDDTSEQMRLASSTMSEALNGRHLLDLTDTEIAELAGELATIHWRLFVGTLPRIYLPAFFTLATLLGAFVIYRTHRARIPRRKKLKPLSYDDDPAFYTEIERLSDFAGVSPPPRIESESIIRGVTVQAFGFPNNYVLGVAGLLRLLRLKSPNRFRAMVLNSLGHIVNGDVRRAYFLQAIWVILFYLFLVFFPPFVWVTGQQPLIFILQWAAILAFLRLNWTEMSRVSEFYADWRTALWGMREPLAKILDQQGKPATPTTREWWERLWRFHPYPEARLDILKNPITLFRLSPDQPFYIGLFLGIVLIGMFSIASTLGFTILEGIEVIYWMLVKLIIAFPYPADHWFLQVMAFITQPITLIILLSFTIGIAYLMSKSLGLQVQRETVADIATRSNALWSYGRLLQPAWWFAISFQLGILITPTSHHTGPNLATLLLNLLWLVSFAALTWLWLAYTRALSQLLIGTHLGSTPPKRARFLLTSFSFVSLLILYFPVLSARLLIKGVSWPTESLLLLSNDAVAFTSEFVLSVIVVLPLSAAILFLFSFGLSLLAIYSWVRYRKSYCPVCNEAIAHKTALGQTCAHCDSDLAAWLYIPALPVDSQVQAQLDTVEQALSQGRLVEAEQILRTLLNLTEAPNLRVQDLKQRIDQAKSERLIETLLFRDGEVSPEALPEAPEYKKIALLKEYSAYRPHLGLEHRTENNLLSFNNINVKLFISSWNQALAANQTDFASTIKAIVQHFCNGLGLSLLEESKFKIKKDNLYAFTIDASDILPDIPVHPRIPMVFIPSHNKPNHNIGALRHILTQMRSYIGRLVFIVQLVDSEQLSESSQRLEQKFRQLYAYDAIALDYQQIIALIGARNPQTSFKELLLSAIDLVSISPFITQGPTPSEVFFGRETEIRAITDHASRASHTIIGGRRIGKTSILSRLYRLGLPSVRLLYHDCSMTPSYDAFCSASIGGWEANSQREPSLTLGELLKSPPTDKPLVLLLDEADKLIPAEQASGWPLFNALRSLSNSGRIQVVLSGERTLRQAGHDPSSPMFNFAHEILLGPLEYDAVEELVTLPMKRLGVALEKEAQIVKQIYDFTLGHPNIVQRFCDRLIKRISKDRRREITQEDVNAILEDIEFQSDFIETYWEAATALEKMILLLMAHHNNEHVRTLKAVQHALIKQCGLRLSAGEVEDALQRLCYLRNILRVASNRYEFAVTAFPRVVAETMDIMEKLEIFTEDYLKEQNQ